MSEQLTASDVLAKAADLIEPEGRWVQGKLAEREDGSATFLEDKAASRWSALGAILHVTEGAPYHSSYFAAIDMMHLALGTSVSRWNDAPELTQAEVVETLRHVAERAKGFEA